MEKGRIVRSVADSLARLHETKTDAASSVDTRSVSLHLNKVVKPNSPSSTLKKAGVALIFATPDPITAVPGVALIAASYATKRNEPTDLDDLAAESRRILRDIRSLRL
jgi:hypothetical protein